MYLCIGDLHISYKRYKPYEEFKYKLKKHLDDVKYDFIVMLGDMIDLKDGGKYKKEADEFLLLLASYTKTYFLIGNHDYDLDGKQYFSDLKHENLIIVDIPVRYGDYIFCPYTEKGNFFNSMKHLDGKGVKMIFAHQEFKRANRGEGIISYDGDVWNPKYPRIISGHIHDYQVLGNIMYVGSPYQFSANDNHFLRRLYYFKDDIPHRINLNLTKCRNQRIKESEIDGYITDKNYFTKLTIIGNPISIAKKKSSFDPEYVSVYFQ